MDKHIYKIITDSMTGLNYIKTFTPVSKCIKKVEREPDDYDLYKDDPKFKELNNDVKEAKKKRDAYKEQIRKQNK